MKESLWLSSNSFSENLSFCLSSSIPSVYQLGIPGIHHHAPFRLSFSYHISMTKKSYSMNMMNDNFIILKKNNSFQLNYFLTSFLALLWWLLANCLKDFSHNLVIRCLHLNMLKLYTLHWLQRCHKYKTLNILSNLIVGGQRPLESWCFPNYIMSSYIGTSHACLIHCSQICWLGMTKHHNVRISWASMSMP